MCDSYFGVFPVIMCSAPTGPCSCEYWAVRPITANRPPDGNDMYLAEHSLPLRIAKTMQKCKKVIQSLVSRKVLATYLARPIDYLNIRLVLDPAWRVSSPFSPCRMNLCAVAPDWKFGGLTLHLG